MHILRRCYFNRTVRVKNLNKDIMEEDLQELFAFYGEVKSVQLVKGAFRC